jgi:hypothetical protein
VSPFLDHETLVELITTDDINSPTVAHLRRLRRQGDKPAISIFSYYSLYLAWYGDMTRFTDLNKLQNIETDIRLWKVEPDVGKAAIVIYVNHQRLHPNSCIAAALAIQEGRRLAVLRPKKYANIPNLRLENWSL